MEIANIIAATPALIDFVQYLPKAVQHPGLMAYINEGLAILEDALRPPGAG